MVLGKLPVPGRPTIWMIVGQGPIALAVGAGGGCLDIFTLLYPFSPLSPSLWETARYILKYCLKGPLNPKQPTNQPFPLGFEGGMWDLILVSTDYGLSFSFATLKNVTHINPKSFCRIITFLYHISKNDKHE